jgi:hypothetical protein
MIRRLPLLLLVLVTISCTFTNTESLSFDDKVATQAAVAMTATALDQFFKNPTSTLEPTITVGATPIETLIPAPTLNNEDPVKSLGQPSWKDELTNAGSWFLSGSFSSDNTEFYPSGGGIAATSAKISDGLRWYLYYEKKPKNIYIEGKFDISGCSGKDQYGIVFRAPNLQDGFAYFYGLTCDGGYNLRKWDTTGLSLVLENASGSSVNSGSNKTNTLGVWAKDDRIRLYANGQFLQEISNSALSNDGHFGLFINARETPGLTIKLDEISYWLIN